MHTTQTMHTKQATHSRHATDGMHAYAARVLADVRGRLPWEVEFLQAVEEVFASISVLLDDPSYEAAAILERLVEPERALTFRVPWVDDQGRVRVNRGYRVQFNSALGPFKGGTRFHASVTLGSLKFLGFEQTFKNALTGLPMGGGKGGADFQLNARSDGEIMRFCQSYMSELYRHIGPDTDVPAGDIGVGGREIGFLFGQYKRLVNRFDGTLTGKGQDWGGSRLRPEATGFGVAYFLQEILRARGEDLEGKTLAVSGFGNVSWGFVKKATELGARVVTLSGPDGFIFDVDGVSGEKIEYMRSMRFGAGDRVEDYATRYGVPFTANARPWGVPCDVAVPCAIQNELGESDAVALATNGCSVVVEGANMPCTREAVDVLRAAGVTFAPGKAANAGGVSVSGLEMAQNSARLSWEGEVVDAKLKQIMTSIHSACIDAAERHGQPGDYVLGANVAGFTRVAHAMMDQGVV